MTHRNKLSMIPIVSALALTLSAPPALADNNACGQPLTDAMKIQRVVDVQDISNVASLHEYYHNALMHAEELRDIWSARDDITWTNNTDKYIGQASMKRFYVTGLPSEKTGALWYHMLTTPVIEVSGDGRTAKGVWMSFGTVSGAMFGQAPQAQLTQEKYGVDFIKENGRWKIWHLRTYVDFYTPLGKSWIDPANNLAAPKEITHDGAQIKAEPGGVKFEDNMKPDVKGEFYIGYSLKTPPQHNPVPPAPFCSFNDVTAY
jgi:hypothetical protein